MTRGLSFPKLAEGLLLGAVAVCALVMSAPPDTYWHLRAGQEIWQTGHGPLVEHYSFTANGHTWPNLFVDARQDSYPTDFLKEVSAVNRGWPYAPLFQRFGIRCAFLPAEDALAGQLRSDGWRTTHADARWAVLTAPEGHAP